MTSHSKTEFPKSILLNLCSIAFCGVLNSPQVGILLQCTSFELIVKSFENGKHWPNYEVISSAHAFFILERKTLFLFPYRRKGPISPKYVCKKLSSISKIILVRYYSLTRYNCDW